MEHLHVLPAQVAEFSKALSDELHATAASLEKLPRCGHPHLAEALNDIRESIAAALDIADVIAQLARQTLAAIEDKASDE